MILCVDANFQVLATRKYANYYGLQIAGITKIMSPAVFDELLTAQ